MKIVPKTINNAYVDSVLATVFNYFEDTNEFLDIALTSLNSICMRVLSAYHQDLELDAVREKCLQSSQRVSMHVHRCTPWMITLTLVPTEN